MFILQALKLSLMITVLNSNKFSRTESTQTEESLTEFEVKTFVKLGKPITKDNTFIKHCKYSGSEINDVMTLQKRNDNTKTGNNARIGKLDQHKNDNFKIFGPQSNFKLKTNSFIKKN